MTEIVRIPFDGGDLLAVDVDGKPFVVLRPAVEAIGLDYSSQIAKLRTRSWVNRRDITTVAADGRSRVMVAVDVPTFLMWLATVNETKVADEVRPLLVSYQRESADAIDGYWTKGGAINPRATAEQVVSLVEAQMRVLQMATGLVDARWLEAKTRHTIARALGEEPELEHDKRPLTVGEYLQDHGVTATQQRSMASGFGKRLKALYRDKNGQDPPSVERFVDGALRPVAGYTEHDRPLFDEVFSKPFGTASRGA